MAAGDYHIHNYPQFSRVWREGLNTRVRDILETIKPIPDLIVKNRIDVFCSLGDWNFNASNDYRLEAVTREFAQNCAEAVRSNSGIVIGIHGNHDTVSGDPDNHNNFPYIQNTVSGPFDYKGVLFHCIGYNTKFPSIYTLNRYAKKAQFHVFLLHKDIAGGRSSQGFIYKSDGAIPQSYFTEAYKVLGGKVIFLNGHYHTPQTIGKVICVGAPVQHNRGDRGDRRGVYCISLPSRNGKRIPLVGPNFVDVLWSDVAADKAPQGWNSLRNYITLIGQNDAEYREAAEYKKKVKANIQVKLERPEKVTRKVTQGKASLMSEEELLKKYLMEREGQSAKDAARLIKINKEVQTA